MMSPLLSCPGLAVGRLLFPCTPLAGVVVQKLPEAQLQWWTSPTSGTPASYDMGPVEVPCQHQV